MQRISPGKKIFLIAGTFVVSALLLLAVLEAGLRIAGFSPTFINPLNSFHEGDTTIGWRGRPGVDARFKRPDFDVHVVMDDQGFRAPDNGVQVAADATPLWFLGDSFTWGWGVSQGEVFTDRLQQSLGSGFHVINRGIDGIGTLQQSLLLQQMQSQLQPGLLGIMLFRNDFDDNLYARSDSRPYCVVKGEQVEIANLPVANPIGGAGRDLLNHSYALSLLVYLYHVAALSLHASQSEMQGFGFTDRELPRDAILAMRFSLQRIADLSVRHGIRPFVVYIPSLQELSMPGHSRVEQAVAKLAAATQMPLLDLTPSFAKAADPRGLYFAHDEHWTPRAHALAAKAIQAFLSRQELMPKIVPQGARP